MDLAERVRQICAPLPEVTERPSHGTPTWFVAGKTFVTVWMGTTTTGSRICGALPRRAPSQS
jgi:hypothetical protein